MVVVATYLLNLLCAMVPCQGSLPPSEAYIGDEHLVNRTNSDVSRPKRLLETENSLFSFMNNSPNRGRNGRQIEKSLGSPPAVSTNSGDVEGYFMGTMKGRRIYAFGGIPYATPPIGNLRFKVPLAPPPAPVANRPWKGTLMAKKPGSHCLQAHPLHFFRISGQEICLFINVYTPHIPTRVTNKTLPILFFIHGGSFMYGSGHEYGPSYLLDEDLILVTFNYRLGALGFLSTGDAASSGNWGLKDQALALKWVHENIEMFGGDKNKVTLMGQSAGGVLANLHAFNEKSSQYFQSGFSLSGNAFGHWPVVTAKRARMWTEKLGKRLRCPTDDNYALVNCLRNISPSFISAAEQQIYDWIPYHPLVVFAPVVEPSIPGAYIRESASVAYENGNVSAKPWIFSFTAQEGHFETYLIKLFLQAGNVLNNIRKYLPIIMDYIYSNQEPLRSKITNEIITHYAKNDSGMTMETISKMYTDRFFAVPADKAIRAHSQIANSYGYIFDFKGQYNLGTLFGVPESEWGKSHTEDLFYFFNSSVFHHGLRKRDPEYKLSEIMVKTLANFMKTGVPSYNHPDGYEMKMWQVATHTGPFPVPINAKNDTRRLRFLQLNEDIKMINFPFEKNVKFWNDLAIQV